MPRIRTVEEGPRGCGYRKKGGLYLMSGGSWIECGKIPIPLTVCPCCGQGFKFSRAWTWVQLEKIREMKKCAKGDKCSDRCILKNGEGRAGLIWIGESHYKTTDVYMKEALRMGFSRRIKFVPRDFKIGETWVLLAHLRAVYDEESLEGQPGIFTVFMPQRIEYVIRGDETEEELERIEKRGIELVDVKKIGQEELLN